MIKPLSTFFSDLFKDTDDAETKQSHTIELAAAVLMIEISLADDHIDEQEYVTIKQLLSEHFNLADDEIKALISMAEKEVDHAVSLYEFTRLLNDQLDATEKLTLIEHLWRVAYADAVLDKYEEYYIRKVADLLYVSHNNYIKTKLNAAPDQP